MLWSLQDSLPIYGVNVVTIFSPVVLSVVEIKGRLEFNEGRIKVVISGRVVKQSLY